jgi:hypothetical protein
MLKRFLKNSDSTGRSPKCLRQRQKHKKTCLAFNVEFKKTHGCSNSITQTKFGSRKTTPKHKGTQRGGGAEKINLAKKMP